MSTPVITKARRKTLRHLCKVRCHGDRLAAKELIHTMEAQFARLAPATQDELLATMAKSVPVLHELEAAGG